MNRLYGAPLSVACIVASLATVGCLPSPADLEYRAVDMGTEDTGTPPEDMAGDLGPGDVGVDMERDTGVDGGVPGDAGVDMGGDPDWLCDEDGDSSCCTGVEVPMPAERRVTGVFDVGGVGLVPSPTTGGHVLAWGGGERLESASLDEPATGAMSFEFEMETRPSGSVVDASWSATQSGYVRGVVTRDADSGTDHVGAYYESAGSTFEGYTREVRFSENPEILDVAIESGAEQTAFTVSRYGVDQNHYLDFCTFAHTDLTRGSCQFLRGNISSQPGLERYVLRPSLAVNDDEEFVIVVAAAKSSSVELMVFVTNSDAEVTSAASNAYSMSEGVLYEGADFFEFDDAVSTLPTDTQSFETAVTWLDSDRFLIVVPAYIREMDNIVRARLRAYLVTPEEVTIWDLTEPGRGANAEPEILPIDEDDDGRPERLVVAWRLDDTLRVDTLSTQDLETREPKLDVGRIVANGLSPLDEQPARPRLSQGARGLGLAWSTKDSISDETLLQYAPLGPEAELICIDRISQVDLPN